MKKICLSILWMTLLTSCAFWSKDGGYYKDDGPPTHKGSDLARIPDAVPRNEPPSRTGNRPYQALGKMYYPLKSAQGYRARGLASWYGKKFHGRRTSSGEPYDLYKMTAAHPTLPIPSYVKVRNLDNGRSVVVRVNDRGPFLHGRIIDLSYAAAAKLGAVATGTARVEVTAVQAAAVTTTAAVPTKAVPTAAASTAAAQTTALTPAEVIQPQALSVALSAQPIQSRLFVQAGAFADRTNAEYLHQRLTMAGFSPVAIQEASQGDARVYRVRVGPLGTIGHGYGLIARMHGHGVRGSRLVFD